MIPDETTHIENERPAIGNQLIVSVSPKCCLNNANEAVLIEEAPNPKKFDNRLISFQKSR